MLSPLGAVIPYLALIITILDNHHQKNESEPELIEVNKLQEPHSGWQFCNNTPYLTIVSYGIQIRHRLKFKCRKYRRKYQFEFSLFEGIIAQIHPSCCNPIQIQQTGPMERNSVEAETRLREAGRWRVALAKKVYQNWRYQKICNWAKLLLL